MYLKQTETKCHWLRNEIGSIFTIVPSKILLCDSPSARIPVGRCSADIDGRRRFSADFYARTLQGLGVVLVLPLDDADYDPAPFTARGIRVCARGDVLLELDATRTAADDAAAPLSAASLQRFVALAQAAGGAVAVHCDRRRLPQVPF